MEVAESDHGIFQFSIKRKERLDIKSPHCFKAISNFEPTKEEVQLWQKRAGYHPDGYGFYNLAIKPIGELFMVQWQCSHSCE